MVKEQVEVMEQALQVQTTRLKIAELQLTETDQKIGADILSEVAEIPKIKIHLQKITENVNSMEKYVKNEGNNDVMSMMSPRPSILKNSLINGNRRNSTVLFNSDYGKRKSMIFQDVFIKEQNETSIFNYCHLLLNNN